MPTVSVCMMVQNVEKTLAIALESLDYIYDELIIVDGGSVDSTCDIAAKYGARVIHSAWTGNHSQQRNVYLSQVKTDWVFVLDADEFINQNTRSYIQLIKESKQTLDSDNFWIPRKWISNFSKNYYITSAPHSPDLQRRLFKYNKDIYYNGQIHESMHNLQTKGVCLVDLSIYHLDLFVNNEEKRLSKVKRYSKIDPRDGGRHFYLPNQKTMRFEEWNYREVLNSVQNLIDKLPTEAILDSQLNKLIVPEIKNDEFYKTIQKIAKEGNIKNVLEIGSSSGEGSTEAFVTGLRENPNQPSLFCMEVSQARFNELARRYAGDSFVKCYNVSSVPTDYFPDPSKVIDFYNTTRTNLNFYPIEQILGWLKQDIEYLNKSGIPQEGIKIIKEKNNIDYFDAVLIDGSEFTGYSELDEVYGAKYILLDDINAFKNYENHQRLLIDSNYELVEQNVSVRNGYSIFKRITDTPVQLKTSCKDSTNLPINFFTIVLNGEPFIRYHVEIFKQLPFKWHWHIIEGVAELKHDTGWSLRLGGSVSDMLHNNGRSNDGTTKYLDELAQLYPDNITIYRQPEGVFWDGKREMVNEPLYNINEECLLWQIDADELWTVEQICTARQMFIDNPDKTAAFYWCSYFVGENLVISTRNCYAQNPMQEWLRTWRYKPGAVWVAHEPPRLQEPLTSGQWRDVAAVNPFLHHETEEYNLIFQHLAYVTPDQLKFKEQYYGYANAFAQWEALQEQSKFPVLLRQYFSWVNDDTMVDTAESCGITPIASKNPSADEWLFLSSEGLQIHASQIKKPSLTVLVDGVFFQLYQTGIARVWSSLLEEWTNNGFARYIIVLDRAGTAPKIPGVRYRTIPPYNYDNTDADREMLQQVCDEEGADVFISTYYTTPLTTPSVFMAHDMIPEIFGWNLNHPMWREKHYGIANAASYIAVSENTARDLAKCFPDIRLESIKITHNGVNHKIFNPVNKEDINCFKIKYGISKPYFILVGSGSGYKNSTLFFQAFSLLINSYGFDIVCTGSGAVLEAEFRACTPGSTVHMLRLSDEELATAYSGAIALVYPSKYEGFGLPVLEAMACGCPVITCPNASIPEVAGEAVIYVEDDNIQNLADALCEVQKPSVRKSLTFAGLAQAQKFSWSRMANNVSTSLIEVSLLALKLQETNFIIFPNWSLDEEVISQSIGQALKTLSANSNAESVTLLIDTSGISYEDAELFISSITMSLLMEEELDVTKELEISLITPLSDIQWEALLPRIKARIILEKENQQALTQEQLEKLPAYELDIFTIHNLDLISV